ncbi:agmatine/peptidylarginine deiminase [Candidatus Methanomassiliicoccus intestinalis]|uniref:agmatine/peptidylarginine deiminase n=1 Tax=Candidatus Methanomassiliicoccus intestinalis TaxID=1406512 RepID=UPI0037DC4223
MSENNPTPKACGYQMPAEWAEHEATWLSWPKNPLTFPEEIIDSVEKTYSLMVEALSRGEIVKILVDDAALEERARALLKTTQANMDNVQFFQIRSSDVWIRDYGPTFILNAQGEKAAIKWDFNAWGAKYDDLLYDNITGENVVNTTGVRVFRPGIVLEGGSIDVNGHGVVLTTEQCLLNPNRNPHLTKADLEEYLCNYLGVEKVVWLKSGIDGDDTDGHVDDFARFVNAHTILCSYADDDSVDAQVLQTNFKILKAQEVFEVVALPMPTPIPLEEEERNLPASYANFYIGNKAVLVPSFDDPADAQAAAIIGKYFPDREMVSIPATDLVYGYGGFHCITQQEPKRRV